MHNCGAWWFPEWFKKWLSKDFNYACSIHDLDYNNQVGKFKADLEFLVNMLKKCIDLRKEKPMLIFKALFFFVMVLVFGFVSYRRAKAKK